MAITRLTAPSITGLTIPNTSINNASLDSVTALPGGIDVGKIGQVINQTSTVDLSTTSTSYSSIFSASITPSSTSSKILITHTAPTYINLSNTSNMGNIAIFRDSTNITTSGHNSSWHAYQSTTNGNGVSIMYLDSPSTTSAISYSVRGKTDNASLTFKYNQGGGQPRMMSLTLMEVLA
jgi:hypothetical protein